MALWPRQLQLPRLRLGPRQLQLPRLRPRLGPHIASGRVRRIVRGINLERGIATPTICTPEELLDV